MFSSLCLRSLRLIWGQALLSFGDFYDFPTSGTLITSVNTACQTSKSDGDFYDVIGSISTLKVYPRLSLTVGDFYEKCKHEICLSGTSGMLDFVLLATKASFSVNYRLLMCNFEYCSKTLNTKRRVRVIIEIL